MQAECLKEGCGDPRGLLWGLLDVQGCRRAHTYIVRPSIALPGHLRCALSLPRHPPPHPPVSR
jgi:hypothetical protein